MSVATISAKGEVIIPASLRHKYKLRPGDQVDIVDHDGVLALVPHFDDPICQANGLLRDGSSLTEALQQEHQQELVCEE